MRTVGLVAALAVLVAASCTAPAPRGSFLIGGPCAPVLLVMARGSDSGPGSDEIRAMRSGLGAGLRGTAVQSVELGDLDGDGRVDPGGYPAVPAALSGGLDPIADPSAGDVPTLGGYNDSRRIGSEELVAVLGQRARDCPDQRIVVAGYSMGATAVGVGLRSVPAGTMVRIDAVALFGDPTVVPGPWLRAPDARFPTGHGLLGSRVPYVPPGVADRTTSWCGSADPYCTGDLAWFSLPTVPCTAAPTEPTCVRRHQDYPDWAVPGAMADAAARVQAHL